MTSTRTIYAWLAESDSVTSEPRTLPACRVWGDVLLRRIASEQAAEPVPSVDIRSSALFGHGTRKPPIWTGLTSQRRSLYEVEVDAKSAAAASASLADDFVGARTWERILEWLVDRGFPHDAVVEEVPPLESPTAAMLVERGPEVVVSTDPDLLGAITDYLRPAALAYLGTWRPLANTRIEDADEIIVPRHAVVSASPMDTWTLEPRDPG